MDQPTSQIRQKSPMIEDQQAFESFAGLCSRFCVSDEAVMTGTGHGPQIDEL